MNTIQQRPRHWGVLMAAGLAVAAIFGAVGCGSGGNGGNVTPLPAPITNPGNGPITRSDEDAISNDAKILASRQATSAFVPLADARAIDADLAAIRAAYPAVAGVRARPDFAPTEIIVNVKYSAPWLDKWKASASAANTITDTDLTTGEAALDALLKKYNATRTADPLDLGTGIYFRLKFAQTLNTRPVVSEFSQASSNFVNTEVNGYFGDGDNITYAKSGTSKVYVFSQGYGDCPGGCINRYIHTYTLQTDGSLSETITGTPPPTNGG